MQLTLGRVHWGWCVFPLHNQSLTQTLANHRFLVIIILGDDSWSLIIILWLNPENLPNTQHTSPRRHDREPPLSPNDVAPRHQLYYFVYNDGRSRLIGWALSSFLMEPTFSGKLSWGWIPICCLNTFFPIDDLCLSYSHFLPKILNDFQTSAHNMPQPWKPNHSCMSWHHSLAILVPLPTSRYRCRTACWHINVKILPQNQDLSLLLVLA